MGVSENGVSTPKANGFADRYPYEKWLFHWEYTLFSDKPRYALCDTVWGVALSASAKNLCMPACYQDSTKSTSAEKE